MKFYQFGELSKPIIILLPGTCCHWKANFGEVIPLLEEDFHVVCASYDGFDETEKTVFPDMLTETDKIEKYINENFRGVRYRKHFKAPDIRRHDLQHEELLVCYPQQWAEEVRNCCRIFPKSSKGEEENEQT